MTPAFMNWSGGKDSALALYRAREEYDIRFLFTVVNGAYKRISIHGVRESLLDAQAAAVGLPLVKCYLPEFPSMSEYEDAMSRALSGFADEGVKTAIFGDIFLEDLRIYREEKLSALGFSAAFPLWKIDTKKVAADFINEGFRAVVVSVDERYLGEDHAGRYLDRDFIDSLPSGVDPCGENGEFHSFVTDGPLFQKAVPFSFGEKVYRTYKSSDHDAGSINPPKGFWYCDLIPE
ncbi:MAG TPA: diphthine--ammonia ligase [Spirochaetota bacterium]